MKISSISLRHFLPIACFGLLLAACEDAPTEDRIEQAKAAYTQAMDIDGDGRPELVVGFKKASLNRLSSKEVVLKGRFHTAATAFETDEFAIGR